MIFGMFMICSSAYASKGDFVAELEWVLSSYSIFGR